LISFLQSKEAASKRQGWWFGSGGNIPVQDELVKERIEVDRRTN